MKRKFWIGASFSGLVIAAMAPWSAPQAHGVSIGVSPPEFGIRIGAPVFPRPIYRPVPVYQPVPVYYPPPRYVAAPYIVGGFRGHGHYPHYWHHRHWQQNQNHRYDRHGDR
jgi:hypothetical protein